MTADQNQSLYGGGDGSTIDKAVVINAASTDVGIPAEYEYVAKLYAQQKIGWTVIRQNLVSQNDHQYDILLIQLSSGVENSIVFDITQFFGK